MPVLTVSDAAKAIGHRSRSQLYRLIDAGRLDSHIRHQDGRRLLESDGLAAAVRDATQQRRTSVPVTQDCSPADWQQVARICNSYLGEHWGPRLGANSSGSHSGYRFRTRWRAAQRQSRATRQAAVTDFSSSAALVATSTNPMRHWVA